MSSVPSYLLLSRHSIYYFRVVVPEVLRPLIQQRELRRSLNTRSRREALIRGREILLQVQRAFTVAFQGNKPALEAIRGSWEGSGVPSWASWLRQQEAMSTPLLLPTPPVIASEPLPVRQLALGAGSPLFSKMVDEHLAIQEQEGVSSKTLDDKRAVATLLIRISGDRPVNMYTRKDAHRFRDVAPKLPPLLYLYPENQSIDSIIDGATSTISLTTYNKYVKVLTTLFTYAVREGYCDKNPFAGIQIKQRIRVADERSIFTEEDIRLIFNQDNYPEKGHRPYRYWLPLMGLYTGARLSELSQLYVDDIVRVSEIDCLYIRAGREDQSLKTPASERLVPIHSKLKEFGILDYVDGLRSRGVDRLFSEIGWHNRHGYGAVPSKWFARYREKLGLTQGAQKKDFHSFRHTFADHLKQKGVAESYVAGILGHQNGGITYGRYGKDLRPDVLAPVIEMFDVRISLD